MSNFDDSIHILLVEDDEIDIADVQRTFQKNKIANPLHIARNGVEALDMLKGTHGKPRLNPTPGIILLDINLPKMNGLEFLAALRADAKLEPTLVFILTSSDNVRDKIEAYKLNVAGYILKPIQFSEFLRVVATLNYYWALLEFPSQNN